MRELKQRYADRYVFFDCPPFIDNPDSMVFSSYVDGILLVVEADRTPRRLVQKAVSMLAPEKLLWLVYNKAGSRRSPELVKDSMYEKFFGFLRKPFEIVPNPDVLYLTDKHQTA